MPECLFALHRRILDDDLNQQSGSKISDTQQTRKFTNQSGTYNVAPSIVGVLGGVLVQSSGF